MRDNGALRAAFFASIVVWLIVQPAVRGVFGLPWFAGLAVTILGVAVIVGIALAVLKSILAPLVKVRGELAKESGGPVYGIELEPAWMPVGNKTPKPDGLGFLIVRPDGIRIVDASKQVIVDASWDDVADVRTNRVPLSVAELDLHRAGTASHWWFQGLSDSLLLRRGARATEQLVDEVRAAHPRSRVE